jgi:hypothetical protein
MDIACPLHSTSALIDDEHSTCSGAIALGRERETAGEEKTFPNVHVFLTFPVKIVLFSYDDGMVLRYPSGTMIAAAPDGAHQRRTGDKKI